MPPNTPRDRGERLRTAIRERIVTGIHAGQYETGDRLPTYRELAEETGADLRAIAAAYRALETEGLVEVRGRAGVFVAPQERIGGRVLAETARWLVGVLKEARVRRVRVPDFPEFVRECIATAEIRCACIDSTEDQLSVLCLALQEDFGFRTSGVLVEKIKLPESTAARLEQLPIEVRKADFLVTSLFHAAALRPLAERLQVPLVVVRLSRSVIRAVEQQVEAGGLTVIHVDPRFPERVRLLVGKDGGRIQGVPARDRSAVSRLDRSKPVLISPAARRALEGMDLPPQLVRGSPISQESAGDLIEILIRFNLEALAAK
jgi:DNA-binding transcriptional regulator YhcF (GntR family)